jgi:DNA-binding response OmpR family regulator
MVLEEEAWGARDGGGPFRILLVEDDLASHQMLRKILVRMGCAVASARTVAVGLALLDTDPNGVILDLMLPDGEGETILRKIRSDRRPIRVAVTTGEGDLDRLRRVGELGPEALIRKPIDLDELIRGLEIPAPPPRRASS